MGSWACRSECTLACVCARALLTVRVDVTLSSFRSSSKCFCHVVFHAGLDLGSNLLPSVLQWNTIDYPTRSQTLNINTAAVKQTQTHSLINRRPRTEGKAGGSEQAKIEVEEIEEFGNIWIFRWIVHQRAFPITNLHLKPFWFFEQWDQWHCLQCIQHTVEDENVDLFIIDAPRVFNGGFLV